MRTNKTWEETLPYNTAMELYNVIIKEYRETDESTGRIVEKDIYPFFQKLCDHLGSFADLTIETDEDSVVDWDPQAECNF